MKIGMTTALMFILAVSAASAADNLKAFPPAGEGMVRYVLHLPKQTDESDFKVELIVGKTVQLDARNRYFFNGRIEAETISGWGFTRYMVKKLGPMAGTLMAVDPNAPESGAIYHAWRRTLPYPLQQPFARSDLRPPWG